MFIFEFFHNILLSKVENLSPLTLFMGWNLREQVQWAGACPGVVLIHFLVKDQREQQVLHIHWRRWRRWFIASFLFTNPK